MTYDSAATRRRILDAAMDEFAMYGLAGSRVDRIAESAKANKKQIYVYFSSKDRLFERVVSDALERLVNAVPFTPDDLPNYAGRMYDSLTKDPKTFRIATWRQLERPEATDEERQSYEGKFADINESDLKHAAFSPSEILTFVLALAQSWLMASPVLHESPPAAGTTRRSQIEEAVRRIIAQ